MAWSKGGVLEPTGLKLCNIINPGASQQCIYSLFHTMFKLSYDRFDRCEDSICPPRCDAEVPARQDLDFHSSHMTSHVQKRHNAAHKACHRWLRYRVQLWEVGVGSRLPKCAFLTLSLIHI